MLHITHVHEMQREADRLRAAGARIGFVPTMGFLHEGHLDLIRRCRESCDTVVVSIFVNPTQFAAGEDLQRYPRDLARDTALAEGAGCDILFVPDRAEVYPPGASTWVQVDELSAVLEGAFRPTHFRGVTTVVTMLFHMVKPHVAVFGQKDAQQALLIRRMVRDLHMDISLVIVPTRREPDGLAMSSRNTYLSRSGRSEALAISRSLRLAEQYVAGGGRDPEAIRSLVHAELARSGNVSVDYVALVDAETLADIDEISSRPALLAIAANVETTRLIDNTILRAETIES
ncbi:MAG: pantoate--beta-alanine ligase [Bacteroidota bacterium]|jgi:pantoate--beta-alanine ligase|nr:pantoate--beta-alanine ligase [Bacteroidota bacterium]